MPPKIRRAVIARHHGRCAVDRAAAHVGHYTSRDAALRAALREAPPVTALRERIADYGLATGIRPRHLAARVSWYHVAMPSADEVEARLARVRAGEHVPVAEHLPLYPDTREDRSEVAAGANGSFLHVTYFREFAPGHGWSVELREVAVIEEAEVRRLLARG